MRKKSRSSHRRRNEHKLFLSRLHAQFEALRSNPKAWAEEQAERDAWDITLTDGLVGIDE
jgi:hypothetical protein